MQQLSLLTPQGKSTLASAAYLKLRQQIVAAELLPGAKLKIRGLCERFGVGLSPIREALNRLSTEGLVEQWDQRGFSVAPLTEADLIDLTTARCWLNEIGLRQSIKNGDAQWEEAIRVAFHRLSRAKRMVSSDPADRSLDWSEAHMAFHQSLIAASGSRWLELICAQLFGLAERYRHIARRRGRSRDAVKEHKGIMDAALARQPDKAVELLNRHFRKTTKLGCKALRESK